MSLSSLRILAFINGIFLITLAVSMLVPIGTLLAFEQPQGQYAAFSSPYSGMPQVITPDGFNRSQQRFGMYRWHITDPIRFRERLRVTIQALGWRSGGRFLPLQDDIASTAFWYQREPHAPFPKLPSKDALEIQ